MAEVQESDFSKVPKILVRAPNWIGDAILSTPAMFSLRRGFPGSPIVVVTRPAVLRVFEGTDLADVLLGYDTTGTEKPLLKRLEFGRKLRSHEFDLAFVFTNSFDSALLARLAGAGEIVGFSTEARGFLLTDPVQLSERDSMLHKAELFMKLVVSKGAPRSELRPEFCVTEQEKEVARQFWQRAGLEGRLVVGIHTGASKHARAWHDDRFVECAREVSTDAEATALFLDAREELAVRLGKKACVAPRNLSLGELAALMQLCTLVLSNDSGPMHLAAAVGTAVVSVFGPDRAERVGPLPRGGTFKEVSRKLGCSPCRQRFFLDCAPSEAGKPPCIETVTVEMVISAVLDTLSEVIGKREC